MVELEKHRQPMKISTHEFEVKQHEIHYIRTISISAFLGSYLGGSSNEVSASGFL